MTNEELKEKFWANHKNIKRKTTHAGELEAQKQQQYFCQEVLAKQMTEEDIDNTFGDYANFVRRWINSELITNNFGKHLYVKLG